jgi:hypothetical protein
MLSASNKREKIFKVSSSTTFSILECFPATVKMFPPFLDEALTDKIPALISLPYEIPD